MGLERLGLAEHMDEDGHYWAIPVTLNDRADGGVSVTCEDLPGLILSGPDREAVLASLPAAITMLLEYKGYKALKVVHEEPVDVLSKRPLPQDVNMKVHTYVVVYRLAA